MDCSSRCGADETAHGCPWSLQRTSLPSFTKYHRTLKTKIRSTSCLQKQGRIYTCSKALICHHIRGKLHIRLKLARLDSLSWTTVQWVSLLWMCARTQTRTHARMMTKACSNLHFRLMAGGSREVGLWSSDRENTLQPNTCCWAQMG